MTASSDPYPSSLIDRLIQAIDRLPGPIWAAYAAAMLASWPFLHIIFWIDGGLPAGSISTDPLIAFFPLYQFFWLILYDYLARVASRSLASYQPLLELDEPALAALDYRFRMLPMSYDWVLIPLAIVLELSTILSEPASFGSIEIRTIFPVIVDFLATAFLYWTFLSVLVRTIRQLRLVDRLHKRATKIDLLELGPAHAFANLTARTGLALGLFVATVILTTSDPTNLLDFVLLGSVALIAIAVFVVPLLGMQAKLEKEKEAALKEISTLVHSVTDETKSRIRDGDFQRVGEINDALNSLLRQKDLLEGIPTWPWEPGTVRGFASTLLLPVLLWIVTRLLERVF